MAIKMRTNRDNRFRALWQTALLLATAHVAGAAEFDKAGWRTLPPEELAMTADPAAPGAKAVYLFTQIDRDDVLGWVKEYRQIKVLTEEGRNLANVSLSYEVKAETLSDIEARVVQPDGSVVPFKGAVHDNVMI